MGAQTAGSRTWVRYLVAPYADNFGYSSNVSRASILHAAVSIGLHILQTLLATPKLGNKRLLTSRCCRDTLVYHEGDAIMISITRAAKIVGLKSNESILGVEPSEIHRRLLCGYLINAHRGMRTVRNMILADFRAYLDVGAQARAADLLIVLRLFLSEYRRAEKPHESATASRHPIDRARARRSNRHAFTVALAPGVASKPLDGPALEEKLLWFQVPTRRPS